MINDLDEIIGAAGRYGRQLCDEAGKAKTGMVMQMSPVTCDRIGRMLIDFANTLKEISEKDHAPNKKG